MTKKRYLMAYAYEVPHYRTFIVEAETEEEAMKIAAQANGFIFWRTHRSRLVLLQLGKRVFE